MTEMLQPYINYFYIVASVLFVIGLKMLNHAATARRGNIVSGIGMLIAIIATCLLAGMEFQWIIVGCLVGAAIGAVASYAVKMTAMPEMVGLFNGFGGLATRCKAIRMDTSSDFVRSLLRPRKNPAACISPATARLSSACAATPIGCQ